MIIAGEYSDEGFSRKNIQGRQEFQRMLNDIQDCKDGVSYVLVNKLRFVEAIKEKIGSAVDTVDMEKQVDTLRGQLKQAIATKTRLERQMDTLDINDAH